MRQIVRADYIWPAPNLSVVAASLRNMKAPNVIQQLPPRPALNFRPSDHPSGALVIYTATTDSHTGAIHHDSKAHGARTAGSWFLTLRVAGGALGVRSRHRTMTIARDYAAAVLAATTGTTHADLLAAAALVDAGLDQGSDRQPKQHVVVIACGAAKVAHPAPAAALYTSAHFSLMLRAARRMATAQGGRVLVLSALHGLVELDTVLDPYDVKMGAAGCVTAEVLAGQLVAIGPSAITTLLPHAYAATLDHAAELAGVGELIDLFADAPGIGYQRGVAARILNAA